MNSDIKIKQDIENALKEFDSQPIRDAATRLLDILGYRSKRVSNDALDNEKYKNLFEAALETANPSKKLCLEKWQSYRRIMQITDEEINQQRTPEQQFLFESTDINENLRTSYMFVAVELDGPAFTRTQLADIIRFMCKEAPYSIMVMFRYSDYLSLAIINRRHHKRDPKKQVLEKVTLIKDINLNKPIRAHIEIIYDLYLRNLIQTQEVKNFDTLHDEWEKILNTEELNKKFYRNLFAWYEWAVETATFPTDENRVVKPEVHVIRLITRLLFIWFIKEKGLVADNLFKKEKIQDLLTEDDFDNGDSYYRAALQNLFFATLNTEIDKRAFSKESYDTNRDFSCYRYKKQMDGPDKLLSLFAQTPFINGGLFDCLDTWKATGKESYRIDCFSDNQYHKLSIPNRLFFDAQQGLIPLLEHYKFTVEENTPIDQEVALDPELLGRVFENLLAAINPETGETARKMTGSYYTPRAIVDYMVEEALVAALSQKCQPTDNNDVPWDERLRYLFDYAKIFDDASEWFDDRETDAIVKTISELKILDPAVGSGAFPMGMLHKLTLALRRLDPDNTRWEALQKELAAKRAAAAFDTQDDQERREELNEIDDTFKRYRDSDFGRKLYLIQNSIFGVDIQPIACQIAKLRFFISLAIEQEPDKKAANFGIKPLPNLETRFVAADTLIGLKTQMTLKSTKAVKLELALRNNREKHFHATTRQQKRACKDRDEELRAELATELKRIGAFADEADNIAQWDPYDQNDNADWFDSELMFGVTDGFDVVIGNPPYIQLQKEGGKLGKLYQDVGFDTFTRTGDIYCLFYEKAHKLLKSKGHLCFITSNKWMRAGYGKKLRNYFIIHTQPVQLLDMGPDVFDATVDTNILLFQNNSIFNDLTTFKGVSIGTDFDKQTGNIHQYLKDNSVTMEVPVEGEPWAVLSSAELNLKRKIEDVGKPLKDWGVNIYRGITTGYNDAFIIDDITREQLIAQDPISVEIIKPLLRGSDIKRYHAQWEKLYLLFIPWHFPLHEDSTITGASQEAENIFEVDYPSIYSHLQQYHDRLSNRNRSETGIRYEWYALQRCAATYYSEFDKEKIVWQEIVREGTFFIDRNNFFAEATTTILTGENLIYLLGLLNSKCFTFVFRNYYAGGHLGSTGIRFKSKFIKNVPIPPITDGNQHIVTEIENKVDKILDAKRTAPDADTSSLEDEIDKLVYELYNLTEDEVAIVEGV
ncbi:type II restriction endonuclease [Candidatus Poribacteria bacterium]|nr:MAG: type II restriction endonuclease [Candidatus Poribacteria bacterium]